MDSILADLFYGELDLASDSFIRDHRYLQAVESLAKAEKALHDTLDMDQRRALLDLVNAHGYIKYALLAEGQMRGLRLGCWLAGDLLSTRYTSP